MISTCSYFRNNLLITDLYSISQKYLQKLTTDVLKYPIFSHVTKLNAGFNKNITNVSFMKSLQILNTKHSCGIDQMGIHELKLVKLIITNNINITNVSFMKSLKLLDISGYNCCMNQNGINGLELVKLNASNNRQIINVSFMKSLKILYASNNCGINQNGINQNGINQNGINGLDLIKLCVGDNEKITCSK